MEVGAIHFEVKGRARDLEKRLHERFRSQRKKGEWFEGVTNEDVLTAVGGRAATAKDY
ncbi:GIY-YIG nuclease family protein [Ferrimonas sediminicola]|uniref:GIY-YIG nuclease family protein n=1 Tax=Ferrimonas sediminicola TaxID=2569538 RepID=UPI003898D9F6